MSENFIVRLLLPMLAALVLVGCESPTNSDQSAAPQDKGPAVNQEVAQQTSDEGQSSEKVLRHAVFFKFKEGTSADDLEKVADSFASLKDKIPAIIDFQWGENNSPENLNDGFTHCFLLTFQDEAGRNSYLPHPEHKAFGSVLRPHMAGVFVIDYWGEASAAEIEKPLKHAVFFKFKDDAEAEQIKKVEAAFADLPAKISAIKDFEWGVNNSPEKHDAGFTHCFMVTFDSDEGRQEYLPHPDHNAFVEVLKPVLDKVRVLDFWAQR